MNKIIHIPNIGNFKEERIEDICVLYLCERKMWGKNVDYIFYAKENYSEFTDEDIDYIATQFQLFDSRFERALQKIPDMLREYCKDTYIDIDHLSDEQIISDISPSNVKWEWNGTFESYCDIEKIDIEHDLVLNFSEDIVIIKLDFDG